VLLSFGAVIVVAVLGVSLGLAGGSARADNGQSVILGELCTGSGTNCETSVTDVDNTGSGWALGGITSNGIGGLYGDNNSDVSSLGGVAAGV